MYETFRESLCKILLFVMFKVFRNINKHAKFNGPALEGGWLYKLLTLFSHIGDQTLLFKWVVAQGMANIKGCVSYLLFNGRRRWFCSALHILAIKWYIQKKNLLSNRF